MKRLVFVGVIMMVATVCFGRTFIYRDTVGRDSSYSVLIETKSDVQNLRTVVFTNNNERYDVTMAADGSVVELRYQNIDDRTDYSARRTNNRILVAGKLKGEPLSKAVNIDSKRWAQFIVYTAAYLARSTQRDMRFWFLNPDDMTAIEMVARRLNNERIMVGGSEVEAAKVRVTLPGIASLFFESFFWFRTRDYVYVRGETRAVGRRNVVTELVKERGE